jgi:hypothetical protein
MVVQSSLALHVFARLRQAPASAQLVQSWQESVWGHSAPVPASLPPVPLVEVDWAREQPQIVARRIEMSQRMPRA